ncbi:MAG: ParB/RepB/Spo0J family partition protein, partial [Oscillospiraceae bacterium]|nr:ParB/RepB/Spo0J family partition protein [Oscillospiraceae bacterium]
MSILLDEEVPIEKPDPDARKSLKLDYLVPFADHPFKLYEGERLDDMVRSVREYGVIVPIIVRPLDAEDGTYEILSGHNRVNAAKIAGLSEVPVVIKKDLNDDEAKLIVTETNLVQRSFADLSHSERAIALKTHLEALKGANGGQGKRTDLLDEIEMLSNPHGIKENGTSYPLDTKLRSNEQTGEKYGLSSASVARYIRISFLIASLQNRVDTDEIAIRPAVSLSYLSPDEQTELNRHLGESAYKVDMKKAESLREFSEGKKLTPDKMIQILSGELNKKPKPKTAPAFKLKAKIYQKYFNGDTPQSEMET